LCFYKIEDTLYKTMLVQALLRTRNTFLNVIGRKTAPAGVQSMFPTYTNLIQF